MSRGFYNNAIFWIDVEKVRPNPYQPRRKFDEDALQSLADSIRQYGVLQPLVVTRFEKEKEDGGLMTEYELIAGERRLRAAKLAGVLEVPALIREKQESDKVKLELAIIENLQREDLNPIERAEAFQKLASEFNFKHAEIAKKIGKSRVYVSNSLRLLGLPEEIQQAIRDKDITEGHARPLMMLSDREEEQAVLFKEIYLKKLTVRESEEIARRVAHDKVRKKVHEDPRLSNLEKELSNAFGTRVRIEKKAVGGKITIDFFSDEDLSGILTNLHSGDPSPYSIPQGTDDSPILKEISAPEGVDNGNTLGQFGQGVDGADMLKNSSGTERAEESEEIKEVSRSQDPVEGRPDIQDSGDNNYGDSANDLWKKLKEMEERFEEGERILTEEEIRESAFRGEEDEDVEDEEDSKQGDGTDDDGSEEEEDDDLYSFENFTV